MVSVSGEGADASSEGMTIVDLIVDGTPVDLPDAVPANTVIPIPGVGSLTLNAADVVRGDTSATASVTMLRLEVFDQRIDVGVAGASVSAG
jgi:hypothetical protein